MTGHALYEELAALDAGGFLSGEERVELREHTRICPECLKAEEDFGELVCSGLPLTVSPIREFFDTLKARPDKGIRARFLKRARLAGVVFSPDVERSTQYHGSAPLVAAGAGLAIAILLVFYGTHLDRHATSQGDMQSRERIEQLQRENLDLTASLSQLQQSTAAQQREIQNLRAQHENDAKTAGELRGEAQQSTNRTVQLLDEAQDQERLLAASRDEVARINQLHLHDEASLVAQQTRITELSDQLRIASATLDMERQLAAEGKDIRELLAARKLHVIDVRDTDTNGKPSKAFGRVFLTEGKSLTFYAFDLNDDGSLSGMNSFELWGVPQDKKGSARSLGFLYVDEVAQRRWALTVDKPDLLKEIDSIFVTIERSGGVETPRGRSMLYAYLGAANHP